MDEGFYLVIGYDRFTHKTEITRNVYEELAAGEYDIFNKFRGSYKTKSGSIRLNGDSRVLFTEVIREFK